MSFVLAFTSGLRGFPSCLMGASFSFTVAGALRCLGLGLGGAAAGGGRALLIPDLSSLGSSRGVSALDLEVTQGRPYCKFGRF